MRTELRIEAVVGALPRIEARGALAGRWTGPDTVHLIGAAATPLGGDELDIQVSVGPGAALVLRSVAATIVLPGAATILSVARWSFEVAAGGRLDVDCEPTIVAGGSCHETRTRVRTAPDAVVRLRERVVIGRTGEDDGGWSGELVADVGGRPLLRHRLELGAGGPTDDGLSAPRALESELRYPDERAVEAAGFGLSLLPLAGGGSLFTRVGAVLAP